MSQCQVKGCSSAAPPGMPAFVFVKAPPQVEGLPKEIWMCNEHKARWHAHEVLVRQEAMLAFLKGEV